MRFFLPSIALLSTFLLIRCAAVPMPAVIIPERGNSVEATAYLGNNGFGLHALYATKRLSILSAAVQRSTIRTDSRAYEFGIGQVFPDTIHKTSVLLMATGGYGQYTAYPFILGASNQIYAVKSDALRLSLYGNWSFKRRGGIIGRFSIYSGESEQERVNGAEIKKHDFSSIGFETILYTTPGKQKHFIMGLGLGVSTNGAASGSVDIEKDLQPSPAYLFIGYRLAKDPKPQASPLPFSQ
ncbi:MAG: hypothetical protein ABIO24_10500 [Saprospiraceae bacterium]